MQLENSAIVSTLYDQDYYDWLQTTINYIRSGNLEQVNWGILLERKLEYISLLFRLNLRLVSS